MRRLLAAGAPAILGWARRTRAPDDVGRGVGLHNDEQGRPVWIARARRAPWPVIWPQLRRYG